MSIFVYVIAATVLCGFSLVPVHSIEIITTYDEDATEFVSKLLQEGRHSVNKTCCIHESYDRSHRFYFTLGERLDGDRLLKVLQKQITYHAVTNATANVEYPGPNHEGLTLSYVLVKVYQGSDINRIHLVDGGAGQRKVSIDIFANNTRYLQYNATLYGM